MIKEFFQKRKENKREELFTRGYAFAAGQLLSGESTPFDLDMMQTDNNYISFDRGMDRAIANAIDKGLIEDDRI